MGRLRRFKLLAIVGWCDVGSHGQSTRGHTQSERQVATKSGYGVSFITYPRSDFEEQFLGLIGMQLVKVFGMEARQDEVLS